MYSHKGRRVEELYGEATAIRTRGRKVSELGTTMETSAAFLKSLADESDGMKGKAVEKLKEIVGDTHVELDRAAKLYKPTGPILVKYADALDEHQPLVRQRSTACYTAQDNFDSAPGYREGRRPFWAQPAPWRSEEEKQSMGDDNDAEDREKERLHGEYQEALTQFDLAVDSWEEAFNAAADEIEDAFDGKIEDGFWDNVDGIVTQLQTVLSWAGMIIAIAAIIIGGPIVALIGAVIGALTLALTIYQVIRGDKGGWDLAIAIVGVIPFGSAGKLFQGSAGRLSFLSEMATAFKPSAWSAAIKQGQTLSVISRFAGGGFKGFLEGSKHFLKMNNPAGIGDIMTRLMFGKNVSGLEDIISGMSGGANGFCNSTTLSAAWQFTYTVVSGSWNVVNKIAGWTPGDHQTPNQKFPWVGAVL